jgi:predicted ATPase/DNA-binding CsgD family transcriptional regulator
VELASLHEADLIPQFVAQTLGLHPASDLPLLKSLTDYLSPKQMLLILDNCEHLTDACAELILELLSQSPNLRILATSREALAIAGESIYPVSGLTYPLVSNTAGQDEQKSINPQELMSFDAVNLLVERARAISPKFRVTPENAMAIVEVCRWLEGMPLALELASARLNVMTIEEIANRLNDRFILLTAETRRGGDPRHHTLRATIDWSYDLLNTNEQALLRRMAVFTAGCTLDMVEDFYTGELLQEGTTINLISSLVNKSLVVADTTGRSQIRYRLLETIRQYLLEKLDQAGEAETWRDSHLNLLLSRAEEAVPKQFEAYQQLWLNWLEAELDNLRAALSWALESKQIEAGLRLCSALTHFWEIHSIVQEGISWMERLLAEADDRVSLKVHVDALVFATFQYMLLGDAQAAVRHARQAVELAEAVGEASNPILSFAMDGLASAAKTAGDYQTAFNITEKNICFYRQSGPSYYLGMNLLSQGENAIQLGYYEIAREQLAESLALPRRDGDTYRMAHTLNMLGDLSRLEQNYEEAARVYENGAALLHELGAQRDLASLLSNLGYVCLHQGDVERAYSSFSESMTIHQSQQNRPGMIECLIGFAATAVVNRQPAAGTRLLAAAATISRLPSASKWKATQMEFDQYFRLARDRLGEADFEAEQAAGAVLSLEQAVEYAQQLRITEESAWQADRKMGSLTNREREIAALIGLGKTNREIAQDLVLSQRTVEKHAANILSKLELNNRAQIVRWAIDQGLVQASE